ncbi:MAG: DNA/RNA non-specific endonuclease [Aureispira sp.]|nr:DNA/RNA non-specific endonuclease [Aureispira sp.]
MKAITRLVLIAAAAITGILALVIGGGKKTSTPKTTHHQIDPIEPKTPVLPEDPKSILLDYTPTQAKGDHLVKNKFYTVSYSSKHKNAEWVAYQLTISRLEVADIPRHYSFKTDPKLGGINAHHREYTNSGYDRGHLAPALDMSFSEQALGESFYMGNVCPQDPKFNKGIWKELENKVRKWTKTNKRLYIVTGPILRNEVTEETPTIGKGTTVPRGFYKVILDYDEPQKKGIAFMFKNKEIDQPLEKFAVSIDEVEEYTGIDFFPQLSITEENFLEGTFKISQWDFD